MPLSRWRSRSVFSLLDGQIALDMPAGLSRPRHKNADPAAPLKAKFPPLARTQCVAAYCTTNTMPSPIAIAAKIALSVSGPAWWLSQGASLAPNTAPKPVNAA
jgi:hypothetical protein